MNVVHYNNNPLSKGCFLHTAMHQTDLNLDLMRIHNPNEENV